MDEQLLDRALALGLELPPNATVVAAMQAAGRRWSEWGGRAELVAEILEPLEIADRSEGTVLLALVRVGVGVWQVWTTPRSYTGRFVSLSGPNAESTDPNPVNAMLLAFIAAKEAE